MISDSVKAQLTAQRDALQTVEASLRALLIVSQRDISAQLEPLQQATVHRSLAQAVSTLYQAYLRLHGADVEGSPFAKDVERLKVYGKKVQKVESEKWLKEHKPSLSVSVAAANRFITHAIPDLTPEQKRALRKTGRKERPAQKEEGTAAPQNLSTEAKDARQEASAFLDSMQGGGEEEHAGLPAAKKRSSSGAFPSGKVKKKKKKKEKAAAQGEATQD